ncbi:MAG: hypothetical protein ACLQIK_15930 [Mycobacterium sp.]|uniref:hypothetical protein n=1 Tax=Mycobacterium sp. TaxID=1785 RepID=UPI003F9E0D12
MRTAPWLALFQFGAAFAPRIRRLTDRLADDSSHPLFLLWPVLRLYAAWFLRLIGVFVAAVLVVLLAALSFVPLLRWLPVALLGLVGDSYAAVADRQSRDDMVCQIKRDLAWCSARSERLVVVAHSQGAMLAREALIAQPLGERVTLIGLGSGLGPLYSLRRAHDEGVGARGWYVLGAVTAGVAATGLFLVLIAIPGLLWLAIALVTLFLGLLGNGIRVIDCLRDASCQPSAVRLVLPHDPFFVSSRIVAELPADVVFIGSMLLLGFLASMCVRRARFANLVESWPAALRLPTGCVRRWIEFSSPYDPVSCGLLLAGSSDDFEEVVNGWCLFTEHTRYRRNRSILLRLLSEIGEADDSLSAAIDAAAKRLLDAGHPREIRKRYVLAAQVAVAYLAPLVAICALILF